MTLLDARGVALSGATPTALASYERALAAFISWRDGAEAALTQALAQAPGLARAHLLRAYQVIGSRDPRRVRSAAPALAAAAACRPDELERLHIAAIARVLADDYPAALVLLEQALTAQPRDVLALAASSNIDYLMGNPARLRRRVEGLLPAWPTDLPGYAALRAMHEFALVECGAVESAEDAALAALALDAGDVRAHHAMAHVFEVGGRTDAGVRWMEARAQTWGEGAAASTHCWWHLALLHLARGDADLALALHDRHMGVDAGADLADLIDASALLWRLRLAGVDGGARWRVLAASWTAHLDDAYCSFSDVHAMLAFVGARDEANARRLEHRLVCSALASTRHGEATRQIGLPACRGLMAFGRGDLAPAIEFLATLPARIHRLGGSHAQRDVIHLTLMAAVDAFRRPASRTQHKKQEGQRRDMRPPSTLPTVLASTDTTKETHDHHCTALG